MGRYDRLADAVTRRTVHSLSSTEISLELFFEEGVAPDDLTKLMAETMELTRKPPAIAPLSVISSELQTDAARFVLRAPREATVRSTSLLAFARDELLAAYLAEAIARATAMQRRPHVCLSLRNVMIERTGGVVLLGCELPAINALVSSPFEPGERWRLAAPEAARGELEDACSDVYWIGALYFEMLTGRRYRSSMTPLEASLACLEDAPPNVREELGGVRESLVELLEAMLSPDRSLRPLAAATAIRAEVARAGLKMICAADVASALAESSLRGEPLTVLLQAQEDLAKVIPDRSVSASSPSAPKRRPTLISRPIEERVRGSQPDNERSLIK